VSVTIAELVSIDVLRHELGRLTTPEHTREFWRSVIAGMPRSTAE